MVLPVTVPAQLSVVTGAGTGAVYEHSPVRPTKTGVTGFVVSTTITSKVQVSVLLSISLTVRVTVVVPVMMVPAAGD